MWLGIPIRRSRTEKRAETFQAIMGCLRYCKRVTAPRWGGDSGKIRDIQHYWPAATRFNWWRIGNGALCAWRRPPLCSWRFLQQSYTFRPSRHMCRAVLKSDNCVPSDSIFCRIVSEHGQLCSRQPRNNIDVDREKEEPKDTSLNNAGSSFLGKYTIDFHAGVWTLKASLKPPPRKWVQVGP